MTLGSDKSLHILNGDATYDIFKKANIKGDTVIWREMLVEGPVFEDISTSEFWIMREQYFQDEYDIPAREFHQKVKEEIVRLHQLSSYDEIILWFEYDLYCQVNLLACLSLVDHQTISLIFVGDEDDKLKGLGQHSPERYIGFLDSRAKLKAWEISYAHELWEAYQHDDQQRLKRLSKYPPHIFRYIRPAMNAHFERSQTLDSVNGAIEIEMLKAVDQGISNEKSLIRHMLEWQEWYGFGDLQYIRILKKMSRLILRDPLRLSDAGYQLIRHIE